MMQTSNFVTTLNGSSNDDDYILHLIGDVIPAN